VISLLRHRSFGALTAAQFLGAFNDNAFKALVLFLAASLGKEHPLPWVAHSQLAQVFGQALPQTLFALPFVVLGPITGSLADRVSKTRIVWWANALEILVMGFACLAFSLQNYTLLMATVFGMGAQSALFGPAKYGIIKELVGQKDLARANSLTQSATMLAILSGAVTGGFLAQNFGGRLWKAGVVYVALAMVGWLISLRMQRTPAYDPTRVVSLNPWRSVRGHWAATGTDRILKRAILSSSFFYMMASLFMQIVIAYGAWRQLPDALTASLHAMTGLGVILGAWAAGRICGDGVEGRLIPSGLLVLASSTLLVVLLPDSMIAMRISLVAMGFGSGLFTIPIRCLIQGRPQAKRRGSIQGLAEVMDFVGILMAGPIFWVMDKGLELSPPTMYGAGGALVGLYSLFAWSLRSATLPPLDAQDSVA